MSYERRAPSNAIIVQRRALLTVAQQRMVWESERLGWTLRFVRVSRLGPMPVLFATERDYLVLGVDGSVVHAPDIELRH
ncbi:MAG TPA: hypothetical protein VGQ93_11180 [Lysobacter sp.]|jgi:hypothetical protein|nr:hypothetical protein [Lysobacter sp.]